MSGNPPRAGLSPSVDARTEPALARILDAAGLPVAGRFVVRAGWISRAWIGEEVVVRRSDGRIRGVYEHEAAVVALLAGSDVPHARHIAHGVGADGSWSVSERLPGRTLHDAWPEAEPRTRQALIQHLGEVLRALHRVPVPADLTPPWLADALTGGPWPAYHPPVVAAIPQRIDAARQAPDHDDRMLADVAAWWRERSPLFAGDRPALVHGDVHGSNVLVQGDRVTGLVDFAEALAQPADAELDTLLRWCARPREFPPTPGGTGLDEGDLRAVPGWLRGAYPELFAREHLPDRLRAYELFVELAILAHHPDAAVRAVASDRIARLLAGRDRFAAQG